MTDGVMGPALVAAQSPIGPSGTVSGTVSSITAFSDSTDLIVNCVLQRVTNFNVESNPLPTTVSSVATPGCTDRGVIEVID